MNEVKAELGDHQIDIISDIHLEFLNRYQTNQVINKIKKFKKSQIIALLGDIGKPNEESYKYFLSKILEMYNHVLLISGNHELYNCKMVYSKLQDKIKDICQELNETSTHLIYYLNRESVEINGYLYVGCTLWSQINNHDLVKSRMNDYSNIKMYVNAPKGMIKVPIKPLNTNDWHQRDLAYVTEQLMKASERKQKVVVLSHHAPIDDEDIHPPNYRNKVYCEAYCTDLSHLFKYQPLAWLYGHTHHPYLERHDGVLIASNPLGYQLERIDEIDVNFTIKLSE